MDWEVIPDARWYEIVRRLSGTAEWVTVGDTKFKNLPGFWDDENGGSWVDPVYPTLWCFAWDSMRSTFPIAGELYWYGVKSCSIYGCSEVSNTVLYRAAPYACWIDGVNVSCYE